MKKDKMKSSIWFVKFKIPTTENIMTVWVMWHYYKLRVNNWLHHKMWFAQGTQVCIQQRLVCTCMASDV